MSKTKIEWADRTWNPVTGCTPISAGCANCYAKRMAERFAGPWGLDPANPFAVKLHPERLDEPLRWKKPSMVFVCSMSDLFHDDVPDDFIVQVFEKMSNAQWFFGHKFLVLTKRPERMKIIIEKIQACIEEQKKPVRNEDGTTSHKLHFAFPLENIWLGVTAENQEQADKRIPVLLSIPAAKRFVSVEPMLGPVDLRRIEDGFLNLDAITGQYSSPTGDNSLDIRSSTKLDWVICGGESGPGARPMHPDWARWLRNQCNDFGTPFMFKQWGEWAPIKPNPLKDSTQIGAFRKNNFWEYEDFQFAFNGYPAMGNQPMMYRVGKKAAGRLLDGKEWLQYPEGGAKCMD